MHPTKTRGGRRDRTFQSFQAPGSPTNPGSFLDTRSSCSPRISESSGGLASPNILMRALGRRRTVEDGGPWLSKAQSRWSSGTLRSSGGYRVSPEESVNPGTAENPASDPRSSGAVVAPGPPTSPRSYGNP